MVNAGRIVLRGPLVSLRAASTGVQLRLNVHAPDRQWLARFPGATVVSEEADEVRIAIPRGTDPLDVLDGARAAGRVDDFGLDLPSLSQLFLESVGPADPPDAPAASAASGRLDGFEAFDGRSR